MKTIIKTMTKGLYALLVFATLFSVMPSLAQAAASFNTHANDNATIRVANVTQNPNCTSCWGSSVSAQPGDTIAVSIYYHNNGNDPAYDTTLTLAPQNSGTSSQHTISGSVTASNANTASGNASVSISGSQQSLSYVSGSVEWFPNQSVHNSTPLPYNQSGSELFGNGLNIGTIDPGWDHQGGVLVHYKVSDEQQISQPQAITDPATNIDTSSATLNGVVDGNGDANTQYWFAYGTNNTLNNSTNTSTAGAQNTSVSKTISGLQSNTTYQFRVYAQNSAGTVSGQKLSFTTDQQAQVAPDVTTVSPSTVGSTNATLRGNVDTNGEHTAASFQWGSTQSLPQQTSTQTFSSGSHSYQKTISGLQPNTTYYYRAYGENTSSGITDTGTIKSFTTQQAQQSVVEPSISTNNATNVGTTGATLRGDVLDLGNATSVTRYFKWGTSSNTGNTKYVSGSQSSIGSFAASLSGLQDNTTYYFRACGENSAGDDCGSLKSFTTQQAQQTTYACNDGVDNDGDGKTDYPADPGCVSPQDTSEYNAPAVTTPDARTRVATDIDTTTARLRGEVLDLGGASAVDRYFTWGTHPSNLSQTETVSGTQQALGFFDTYVSGLSENTTYYYRACAENSAAVDCGSVESFTTDSDTQQINQPEVRTRTASNIKTTQMTLRGDVEDVGDDPNGVDRYFTWGTSVSALNKTLSLSGTQTSTGNFSKTLYSLEDDTIYYFRTCVENSAGTHCGDIKQAQTQADTDDDLVTMPEVRTRAASDVRDDRATLRGEVEDTGDDPDGVDRYFEWGEDDDLDYTLSLAGTQDDEGLFDKTLYNLDDDTRYYFRACVENSAGDDCGSIESFRTDDDSDDDDDAERPYVETRNATNIEAFRARLNGYIDANNDFTEYRFEYGTNKGLLNDRTSERSFGSGSGSVDTRITGLRSNTRYYFRLVAWNDEGTERGLIRSFRTDTTGGTNEPTNEERPVAITGPASLLTQSSARLNGVVLNDGNEQLSARFEWGPTTALNNTTSTQSINRVDAQNISRTISGLQAGQTYYYRIIVTGSDHGTIRGDVVPFSTQSGGTTGGQPPVIIDNGGGDGGDGLPPLVQLTIEADFENIGPGDGVTYTVDWKNITGRVRSDGSVAGGTIVSDAVLRVVFPEEIDYERATRGTFSDTAHTLTYEIGTLAPQQEGDMTIQVEGNRGILRADPPIVTSANLAFKRPDVRDGDGQRIDAYPDDVIDYVLHNLSSARGGGLAGLALFSGFFPSTFLGWLLIVIAILVIILIARYIARRRDRQRREGGNNDIPPPYAYER